MPVACLSLLAFISTLSTAAMIGDVNIYMNDPDDMQLAEIEIMIAEHKRYLLYNTDDHFTVFTILPSFLHLHYEDNGM